MTGFNIQQCVLGRKCAGLSVWGVSVKSYHILILSEAWDGSYERLCVCVPEHMADQAIIACMPA